MNKVAKQSEDLYKEKIEQLKKIYPALFNDEGNLNEDELRAFLKQFASTSEGKYEFNWAGKMSAKRNAFTTSRAMLKPDKERSIDFDNTENLIIEGDNLEVLKLLQKSYQGKIKCIYIDPPYNTGKDFIYTDNFSEDKKAYWERSGTTQEGVKLDTNTESQGRYHSNWLNMIYPRLILARNLLAEDGAIFISIDDNELHNLRKVMDEIFGEENFINIVSVKSKPSAGASGGGKDKKLKKNIEYLIIYAKTDQFQRFKTIYVEKELISYIEEMKKSNKSFKYTSVLCSFENRKLFGSTKDGTGEEIKIYQVINPIIKNISEICKDENLSLEEAYNKYYDKVFTTTNAQTSIRTRVWEATENSNDLFIAEYVPKSGKNEGKKTELMFTGKQKVLLIWLKDTAIKEKSGIYKRIKVGTYWDGFSWINVSKEGNMKFDNGKKPVEMIKRVIEMQTNNNDIILDFFAGSGTTGQAVVEQNLKDNGQRKYILIQIPEQINEKSELYKAGYKKISDICVERVKRVSNKLREEKTEGDLGFKVFTLSPSYFPENLFTPDPEKTEEENKKALAKYIEEASTQLEFKFDEFDLMYEVLLKDGFTLNFKAEKLSKFAKNNIYKVSDGEKNAFITLDSDLKDETLQELQKYTENRFICLERAVDTTKKWNLQNMFGRNLWVI